MLMALSTDQWLAETSLGIGMGLSNLFQGKEVFANRRVEEVGGV